jgi:hypothetical protein
MSEIKILKAGQTGYGYLIENDGYIDPKDNRNKRFITEIQKLESRQFVIAEPLTVFVVLQKYGVENRNGRIYPEPILKREANNYQELIRDVRAIGESDHPESSIISVERIAHNITKMWWEGHTLVGEMEIIMSPGFINYGIISCQGDMVANLLRKGIMIGVSSRGVGSLEEIDGRHIVQDDFELICWDIVTAPSTLGSWMFTDKAKAKPFMESKINDSKIINENLNEFLDKFLL